VGTLPGFDELPVVTPVVGSAQTVVGVVELPEGSQYHPAVESLDSGGGYRDFLVIVSRSYLRDEVRVRRHTLRPRQCHQRGFVFVDRPANIFQLDIRYRQPVQIIVQVVELAAELTLSSDNVPRIA